MWFLFLNQGLPGKCSRILLILLTQTFMEVLRSLICIIVKLNAKYKSDMQYNQACVKNELYIYICICFVTVVHLMFPAVTIQSYSTGQTGNQMKVITLHMMFSFNQMKIEKSESDKKVGISFCNFFQLSMIRKEKNVKNYNIQ